MYRGVPTASKILRKKEKERDDHILFEKLKSIQNRKNAYSLKRKSSNDRQIMTKNNYYKKRRETEIKRENKILASKMLSIENKNNPNKSIKPKLRKNPNKSKTRKKPPRSLNIQKRRREMMRITMDNISLMNRIQSMKSFYNPREIGKHNYKHQKLLEMHCEYPVVLENMGTNGKFFTDEENERSSLVRKINYSLRIIFFNFFLR